MKTLQSFTAIILVVLTLLLASCKKDYVTPSENNISNAQTKKKCLPVSFTRNNRPIMDFSYLADGKIDAINIQDTNEVFTGPLKMVYNSNGLLTKAQYTNQPLYYIFDYNAGNKVNRTALYADEAGENSLVMEYRHEYNEKGQQTKLYVVSPWFGNDPYGYYTFEYDAKGNAAKIAFYMEDGNGEFIRLLTIVSQFDDKNNPFYGLNVPNINYDFIMRQGPNNIVQSITYDENNRPSEASSSTSTYNTNGYPEEIKYNSNEPMIEKLTYACN